MSREIKFKAFVNNQLHGIGVYSVRNINFYPFTCQVDIDGELISFFDFDNLKLIQFTGLKDKHGREIYEGDLVLRSGLEYEIKFEIGSFMLVGDIADEFVNSWNDDVYPLSQLYWENNDDEYWISDLEVIGNKYEGKSNIDE